MKRCARCDHEYDDAYDACPKCAQTAERSDDVEATLRNHSDRLDEVERLLNASDVYHFDFWPRAWAIFGHNVSVGLLLYAVTLAIAIYLAVLLSRR